MVSDETARRLIHELRRARTELMVLRAVDYTVHAFGAALDAPTKLQGAEEDIIWRAEQELQDGAL